MVSSNFKLPMLYLNISNFMYKYILNEWVSLYKLGINHGYLPGRNQPLKIDTSSQNLPLTVNLKLTAKHFHPLKRESKETSGNANEGCIDPNTIIDQRNDFNCSTSCIPIMFSSLINMSMFKECPDYDNHVCDIDNLFGYLYDQGQKCNRYGVEKYFDGIVDVRHGTSYYQLLRPPQVPHGNDDLRNRTLLTMTMDFNSPYTTVYEEELLYDTTDLISWLGGAIGIFVGYSVLDLSNQLIDVIFNCITTTVLWITNRVQRYLLLPFW